jgi:tight adherence protein B
MSGFANNYSGAMISLLVFVSVLLALEALYLVWRSRRGVAAKRLRQRLDALAKGRDSGPVGLHRQRKLSDVSGLGRALEKVPLALRLERFLGQSGLRWTVSGLVLASLAGGMAALGIATVVALPLPTATLLAVVLAALPWAWVARARHRRLARFQQQLPEALELIVRALRAGYSLPLAIKLLADEMPEPIAGEFGTVHEQVNFGVAMQQSLLGLCDRVPLTDLRFLVVSILIQRQSGGNLTEILGNLARLIRERFKLHGRIKVLSSEGRMSAWTLGLLPPGIGVVLNLANPEFMSRLWTDPMGIAILQSMLFMTFLGAMVMVWIVKIRV